MARASRVLLLLASLIALAASLIVPAGRAPRTVGGSDPRESADTTVPQLADTDRLDILRRIGMPVTSEASEEWSQACIDSGRDIQDCWMEDLSVLPVADAVLAFTTSTAHFNAFSRACHPTSHMLGRRAYDEIKDPYTAVTTVSRACESGMYHGVFEEWGLQSGGDIGNEASDLCRKLEGTDIADICDHGIGHAFFWGFHDVPRSLEACRNTENVELIGCTSGVTMSFVQEDAVDFKSVQEIHDFCVEYPEDIRDGCITETAGMLRRLLKDVHAVVPACLAMKDIGGDWKCTQAAGMQVPYAVNMDYQKIIDTCATTSLETDCLRGAKNQLEKRPSPEAVELEKRLCAYRPAACTKENVVP